MGLCLLSCKFSDSMFTLFQALAHKTLVLLLGVDPSKQLDHPLPTAHPHVTYAYMKYMWKSSRKARANSIKSIAQFILIKGFFSNRDLVKVYFNHYCSSLQLPCNTCLLFTWRTQSGICVISHIQPFVNPESSSQKRQTYVRIHGASNWDSWFKVDEKVKKM